MNERHFYFLLIIVWSLSSWPLLSYSLHRFLLLHRRLMLGTMTQFLSFFLSLKLKNAWNGFLFSIKYVKMLEKTSEFCVCGLLLFPQRYEKVLLGDNLQMITCCCGVKWLLESWKHIFMQIEIALCDDRFMQL